MENPTAELFCTILTEIEEAARAARLRVSDPGAREALAHFGAELSVRVSHVRKELIEQAVEKAKIPFPPVPKPPLTVPKATPTKGKP